MDFQLIHAREVAEKRKFEALRGSNKKEDDESWNIQNQVDMIRA